MNQNEAWAFAFGLTLPDSPPRTSTGAVRAAFAGCILRRGRRDAEHVEIQSTQSLGADGASVPFAGTSCEAARNPEKPKQRSACRGSPRSLRIHCGGAAPADVSGG